MPLPEGHIFVLRRVGDDVPADGAMTIIDKGPSTAIGTEEEPDNIIGWAEAHGLTYGEDFQVGHVSERVVPEMRAQGVLVLVDPEVHEVNGVKVYIAQAAQV